MKTQQPKICKYRGYRGERAWKVTHPEYGIITALAVDEASAIAAAGKAWGTDWLRASFHGQANVEETEAAK